MSNYETGTKHMEKFDGKSDEMIAKFRTALDKTATLIIDEKHSYILSYADGEGTAHTTGACNASSAKLMLMGIIDTVGNILGAATDDAIENQEHRSLAIIFLALNMLIEASNNKQMLAVMSAHLLKQTLEDFTEDK